MLLQRTHFLSYRRYFTVYIYICCFLSLVNYKTTKTRYIFFVKAWNLFQTGKSCETVDPSLAGNFQEEEASRLLQIGLLCAQASAELRPTMSSVVKMIRGEQEVPQPAQPPFLNSTSSGRASFNQLQRNHHSRPCSNSQSSGNSMTESIEPR